MTEEKAKKIERVYNIIRFVILVAVLLIVGLAARAQTVDERISKLEAQLQAQHAKDSIDDKYMPQLHGIMRGKYEYEPDLDASRFEVRNARLAVTGNLPLRSEYKLEVDLCDETEIKMKDAWVRVKPWKTLRISLGQQRMPFSIDAHRNPSAQYFANRSFIAKQVGDMRDVGGMVGYDFLNSDGKKVVSVDAGLFNGASITSQKTAWHGDINYSARLQWFPMTGLVIMPSIQHDAIADRQAHYTSLDLGAYYDIKGWHVEGEYLHKTYEKDAFQDCSSVDAMLIYRHKIRNEKSYFEAVSFLGRYDWMGDHSNGKSGFVQDANGNTTSKLVITDYERHRMTLGMTFSVRNPYFPTDLRLNYEKYWYPNGGAKESEQDKIVAEIAIKF